MHGFLVIWSRELEMVGIDIDITRFLCKTHSTKHSEKRYYCGEALEIGDLWANSSTGLETVPLSICYFLR